MKDVLHCTDQELVGQLQRLMRADRALSVRLLVHIGEVDGRGAYREQAYSSMIDYTVTALGKQYPRILELFESRALHLTSIKLLATHLAPDKHANAPDNQDTSDVDSHRDSQHAELFEGRRGVEGAGRRVEVWLGTRCVAGTQVRCRSGERGRLAGVMSLGGFWRAVFSAMTGGALLSVIRGGVATREGFSRFIIMRRLMRSVGPRASTSCGSCVALTTRSLQSVILGGGSCFASCVGCAGRARNSVQRESSLILLAD